jgi:hypothetical protein
LEHHDELDAAAFEPSSDLHYFAKAKAAQDAPGDGEEPRGVGRRQCKAA